MAHDRNAKAREEFKQARERKQFLDAFNSGAVRVVDIFGNPILPGALVYWEPPHQVLVHEVIAVNPVLDPNMPPGVRIVLAQQVPLTYQVMQARDLVIVGRKDGSPAALALQPATEGAQDTQEPMPALVQDSVQEPAVADEPTGAETLDEVNARLEEAAKDGVAARPNPIKAVTIAES
jgi:hypothetical protein